MPYQRRAAVPVNKTTALQAHNAAAPFRSDAFRGSLAVMGELQPVLRSLVQQESEWVGHPQATPLSTGAAAAYLLLQQPYAIYVNWSDEAPRATGIHEPPLRQVTEETAAVVAGAIRDCWGRGERSRLDAILHVGSDFFRPEVEDGLFAPIHDLSTYQLDPAAFVAGAALVDAAISVQYGS